MESSYIKIVLFIYNFEFGTLAGVIKTSAFGKVWLLVRSDLYGLLALTPSTDFINVPVSD